MIKSRLFFVTLVTQGRGWVLGELGAVLTNVTLPFFEGFHKYYRGRSDDGQLIR